MFYYSVVLVVVLFASDLKAEGGESIYAKRAAAPRMRRDDDSVNEEASVPSKREEASVPSKRAVSAVDIQTILETHNSFRKNESSSNIKKLEWDATLAAMGEGWANKCKFAHGQPDTPESSFSYPGQNIYAKYPYPSNNIVKYNDIIFKWFDEKKYYNYDDVKCSRVCGHYTQVVWHDTTHVGCGIARCPQLEGTTWKDALVVVCNYGPGGNWRGEKPYSKGDPCASCPNTCEDGLCLE